MFIFLVIFFAFRSDKIFSVTKLSKLLHENYKRLCVARVTDKSLAM